MDETSLLLLFDANRPCWSGPLVQLAGEDPSGLSSLREKGLLEEPLGGAYVLTPAGRARFSELARESFLDAAAGELPGDPGRSLACLETILRLDRGFHSPWGSKEGKTDTSLAYFPALPAPKGFEGLEALEAHPLAKSFAEAFPRVSPDGARPSAERLRDWAAASGAREGSLDLDVLFLHRYDYTYYMDATAPGDSMKLLNTDRLMIRLAEPLREGRDSFMERAAGDLASLRGFLGYARGYLLPGQFDTDTQEQSSITWWVWVTRTKEEASLLQGWLAPLSDRLIGSSAPLDFWLLSLEALRSETERHETFYELFESVGITIARTA
jgi:hypothetical protein